MLRLGSNGAAAVRKVSQLLSTAKYAQHDLGRVGARYRLIEETVLLVDPKIVTLPFLVTASGVPALKRAAGWKIEFGSV